ncbi:MAG: helix-turn-helix transcriptional regulator [Acidimicrobiales bacterium]
MWSNLRADAALRELEALSGSRLEVTELHAHSLDVLARVVPFDGACMGAVDPDTLLLTSGVTVGFDPSADESDRFVEIEYGTPDPNSFGALVARRVPLVADAGGVAPRRRLDLRYNELGKLLGFAHEVRLVFTTDDMCWAVGDLYRSGNSDAFDDRELAFLEVASRHVAAATRAAAHGPVTETGIAPFGAAVLLIAADGSVTGVTEAARSWIEGLRPDVRRRLQFAVRAAVTVARTGVPTASTRLRLGGVWTVVRAAPMQTSDATPVVAVTIDQASPIDLTELRLSAHGLSRREREVCAEVLAGGSTKEIAQRLFIGANTVQDHLKSIFTKTGVRSRRELVAVLSTTA